MKNTSIRFTKARLESIKHKDKLQKFFDLACEGLSLHVQPKPSLTKSYYASWGIKSTKADGKQKTSGRQRYICRFNQKPLEVVKRLINIKLPEWKKSNETSGGQTVETLVSDYINNGAGGYRIKSKGSKLKYKDKTTGHYKYLLDAYVLGNTEKQQLLDTLNGPYKLAENNYYKKSLPKILLKELSRSDVQIWHQKLEQRPTAANKALAALSVVFEWDSSKLKPMFKGINPCLRILKYPEKKDKKYIDDFEKVTNIVKYTDEQHWRDPHFLTFYRLLMEEGERLEDHYGLLWKKPINKTDEKDCTGWIDFRTKSLHLKDTKNREPADVELTDEMLVILQKLQYLVSEENSNASFAVGSRWVFPRATDPSQHVNENSYRVKLRNFHYKMGLTTREYVRGKGKRKVYKYTNHLTLKHLRKTFVTYYGRDKGLEAASIRMRHSSMEITKNHYYTEDKEDLKTKHSIYKPEANVIDLKKADNDEK